MKLKPRKIAEAVAEKILMASGYLTSIVIVLIVVFLFREGAGLFDSPAVEQGYVLAVNRANPVQSLTPEQIMQIFDADLTNWSEVGGSDDSILVLPLDDITSYATEQELGADLSRAPQCLSRIVADHPNMIAYLPEQYVAPDFAGKVLGEGRITPASFFAGRQWYPTAAPAPAVRPDSAAGRHAVGQSGGHPDRIAAGAFRRHLHGPSWPTRGCAGC